MIQAADYVDPDLDPIHLIHSMHGQLLRLVAQRTGYHHQGIQQAGRYLRQRSLITAPMAKKLANIDVAYNIARHITVVSSRNTYQEFQSALFAAEAPPDEEAAPMEAAPSYTGGHFFGGAARQFQDGVRACATSLRQDRQEWRLHDISRKAQQ